VHTTACSSAALGPAGSSWEIAEELVGREEFAWRGEPPGEKLIGKEGLGLASAPDRERGPSGEGATGAQGAIGRRSGGRRCRGQPWGSP
jgi:hypothetical protein